MHKMIHSHLPQHCYDWHSQNLFTLIGKVIGMDIHGQSNHTYHGKPIIKSKSYVPWDMYNACASHCVHLVLFGLIYHLLKGHWRHFIQPCPTFLCMQGVTRVRATLHTWPRDVQTWIQGHGCWSNDNDQQNATSLFKSLSH